MLIGSDNLVFDELAIELATINAEVWFIICHTPTQGSDRSQSISEHHIKEQINDHGFSWLFCSPILVSRLNFCAQIHPDLV